MSIFITGMIFGIVIWLIGKTMERGEKARWERELELRQRERAARDERQREEDGRRRQEYERKLLEKQRLLQEQRREREARPYTGRRQDWIIIAAGDPRDLPAVRHRHCDGEMVAARDRTPTRPQALSESGRERWIWRCRCGEHWSLEQPASD